MELTIFRGTNQIGGSSLEIKEDDNRILFDFGIPLDAMNNKENSLEDYKLNIKGFYKQELAQVKAMFLTHAHPDHYGLLELVNPEIPIYTTITTYQILKNIAPLTTRFQTDKLNLHIIDKPIEYGNIRVIAHNIDHSISGACAYEITNGNKTILYTGDIRFHGRTYFESINLSKNIKNLDYLIMEGTTLNRDEQEVITEDDLIPKFVEEFQKPNLPLVLFSPQNLDRFITVYKACLKTRRTLVIDPYTCYILELYGTNNKNIPQFDWNNIKVYFAPNSITKSLEENNHLWKYAKQKISICEIIENPKKYVIKGNSKINAKIFERMSKEDLNIIFSMWKGYLDRPNYLDEYRDIITHIHTSGHAYIKDLQRFVDKIKPKYIIPIHTESKNRYKDLFNAEIKLVEDGETIEL